ncbi:MAG: lipocalin family protein [Verrucomicrobiota bacterium]
MDHEISSSQLSPGQIGWNWTSAIFDDGTELMAYVMRREDGKTDPFSQLYLIDKESRLTSISSENFSWEPIEYWKSDDTGGNYPIKYRIRWVDDNGDSDSIVVATPHPSQELIGAIGDFAYWEGAGIAYDASGKRVGQVYTELTGYNKSLYGTF